MNRIQDISWADSAVSHNQQLFLANGEKSRINIFRIPWIRPLIESPWPQLLLRALTLAGFVFTIFTGLFGSLVGSHNFAIIFVWIAWWSAFKLAFLPLGGRSWCSICPIPLPGDWLQQGGILQKGRRRGLNLRWPRQLKGSWLQSGAFLLIGIFSALTLTDPRLTGWIFVGLFLLAIVLSLVFEKRAFCSHICPIGGISSLYAQVAPVELRIINIDTCSKHDVKSCYQACPWGLYPVAFRDSSACGLCMECLRACPTDNLVLNIRPFGADIGNVKPPKQLDKAFFTLVMLGSVLTFTAVYIGQWGWLKSAAFDIGSIKWLSYTTAFLTINLLLLPALFGLTVWLGRRYNAAHLDLIRDFSKQSQVLLPLGLMAWIAFTVSFALPKLGYVLGVVNDPFGQGWRLLGTGYTYWQPDLTGHSQVVQVVFLLIGLFWSARTARQLSEPKPRLALPVLIFCLVFTLFMLLLLIG